MSRCLFCHQPFFERVSWHGLLLLEEESALCPECETQLITLEGRRCHICSRALRNDERICHDCLRWQQRQETADLLERNMSLYQYNAFLKEVITMFKFRGDAELARFFAGRLKALYQKEFRGYLPVEIPLSEARLKARGFNQSLLLMEGWAEETKLLQRASGEKQSKRSRRQRIARINEQPFHLTQLAKPLIEGKKLVLIDDIYTTGTTVRQAARILKRHGAERIASLTIAR
ncbi:ComF family protein [Alkalihalobacillus oceani]|uniref:ComF family protein n=1 Tax=Halalkalibacter oceani TaxID=1653776 RepID=UPI00204234D5|nr:ComF family protein [Halalkalibacter oceani]MCM3760918.1 ComF family protein [Halalkalibacter oceani]